MEPKLRDYIENLFVSAPKTKQAYELKEEIICNVIERYHDLLAQGKTEGDAYNQAIAGIGDINELIAELGGEVLEEGEYTDEQMSVIKSRQSTFSAIAVALYILCATPIILLSDTMFGFLNEISPVFMFWMISIATGLCIYAGVTKFVPVISDESTVKQIKKKGILRAVAVGMYISCVTPVILFSPEFFGILSDISPVFMFLIVAAATVIIIMSKGTEATKPSVNMVEDFKEWSGRKKKTSGLYKAIVAILWVTASIVYILLTTYLVVFVNWFAVNFTWIIFIIANALQHLIRAIFDYSEASK